MKKRSFEADNQAYEAWLRTRCDVVEEDLAYKRKRMCKNAFVFLRATYFRWALRIEDLCPELRGAPRLLCVGDLHVENFGTWRDGEGRLVWGVNDFDEASEMPYALDLLRLATSVRLSPARVISGRAAADALLNGYRAGLAAPRPVLLDEQETWMRPYVACADAERAKFWDEVDAYETKKPPAALLRDLKRSVPKGALHLRYAPRPKRGGGSLGRPRWVVIADWGGGQVLREAKALMPSAWDWAHGRLDAPIRFAKLSNSRYRSPDPFLKVKNGHVLRRIAPDSRKVDLGDEGGGLTGSLLHAMGFDLASLHAGNKGAVARIHADLAARPKDWLLRAASVAEKAVREDYEEWKAVRAKEKKAVK